MIFGVSFNFGTVTAYSDFSIVALLPNLLHRCYRKRCTLVTQNAALLLTENAALAVTVNTRKAHAASDSFR